MQTENPDEYYDASIRNRKFGRVDALNGPVLLEKYVLFFLIPRPFLWEVFCVPGLFLFAFFEGVLSRSWPTENLGWGGGVTVCYYGLEVASAPLAREESISNAS